MTEAASRRAEPVKNLPQLTEVTESTGSPSNGGSDRVKWGHKAEFVLTLIGLAVGLGNVWRFPYLCQKNGGGAFLIPYFIFMVIEGLPLFILELSIGQRLRKGGMEVWKQIHSTLAGLGVASLVVSLSLCTYYIVIISWCFYYFAVSLTTQLPWQQSQCPSYSAYNGLISKRYSIERNITTHGESAELNKTLEEISRKLEDFPDCCVRDPPQWYFYEEVLIISTDVESLGSGINLKLLGCLLFVWLITYLCIIRGIKTTGKVVYVTSTMPYIILIILLVRGLTLEGAGNGLIQLFKPKWEMLADPEVWMEAATQMFYSLSLSFGAITTFASYMPMDNQVIRDGYLVVFTNCGTSVLAGMVVFSILGYREAVTGISATEIGSGPGMAFITFSEIFLKMEISPLWAALFFFMLILVGLDSEFGTLQGCIPAILDLIHPQTNPIFKCLPRWLKSQPSVTVIVCVTLFLIGLTMVTSPGFFIVQMYDKFSVTVPLLIIALFECIAVAWVYGNERFADDIQMMTGKRPWKGWLLCWKYISPLTIISMLIAIIHKQVQNKPTYTIYVGCPQSPFSHKYKATSTWMTSLEYPGWAHALCVILIVITAFPILVTMIRHWPKEWRRILKDCAQNQKREILQTFYWDSNVCSCFNKVSNSTDNMSQTIGLESCDYLAKRIRPDSKSELKMEETSSVRNDGADTDVV